jgi:hypothetical protein
MEEQALANGSKDSLSVNGVSDGQLNAKHDVRVRVLDVIVLSGKPTLFRLKWNNSERK